MEGRSRSRTFKAFRKSMGSQLHQRLDSIHVDKMRTMSTSTPIISQNSLKMDTDFSPPTRSLSVSVCSSINDSGYADSLADCECSNYHGYSPCDVSSSACKCAPHISRHLEMSTCLSPFDRRFNIDRSVNGFEERLNGKDWEIPDEENIYEKFQSTPSLVIPKYNLDTDSDSDSCFDSGLGAHGLIERFDQMLAKFSPKESDRLIGRKMGLNCVDIISELLNRNMDCVVKVILGFLQPADLCRMIRVNRKWKTACDNDTKSNNRRKKFLEQERSLFPGKENAGKLRKKKQHRGLTDAGGDRKLAALQFVGAGVNITDAPSSLQEDLFLKAANCLKNDEQLKKCPKCQFPAKVLPVQDRGQCQNVNCQFDFCVKCFYEFHGARPCVPVASKRTKTDSIGGKKSKRNLKRL